MYSMSVGERQRVEIIRALLRNPSLLIMDEPTSVLTPQAVQKLFITMRQLASEGCSILYISHKLEEIRDVCERATVLRAGKVVGTVDPRRETTAAMARMMIGSDLPTFRHDEAPIAKQPRLEVNALSVAAGDPFGVDLTDVELTVRAGEIVGIAGISGNGQKELLAGIELVVVIAVEVDSPIRQARFASVGRSVPIGIAEHLAADYTGARQCEGKDVASAAEAQVAFAAR